MLNGASRPYTASPAGPYGVPKNKTGWWKERSAFGSSTAFDKTLGLQIILPSSVIGLLHNRASLSRVNLMRAAARSLRFSVLRKLQFSGWRHVIGEPHIAWLLGRREISVSAGRVGYS